MNKARSPGGTRCAAISLAKLVALTHAISDSAKVRDISFAHGRDVALPHFGRAQSEVAQKPRLAHGEHAIEFAEQPRRRASSRRGRCGRSSARRAAARPTSRPRLRPRDDLRIHGRLKQPVVEETGRAVRFAVHRNEPHHARRWVERLRQPAWRPGDFVGRWSAGHAAH